MVGQTNVVWSVGANAGSIIVALIAFYQFVMRGLDKRIKAQVSDDLRRHMKRETKQAEKLELRIHGVAEALESRTVVLDNLDKTLQATQQVLEQHMRHDDEVITAAQQALTSGQGVLVAQLETQHGEVKEMYGKLDKRVRKHVQADEEAFARIEETLTEVAE